jgi:hypothetical protein
MDILGVLRRLFTAPVARRRLPIGITGTDRVGPEARGNSSEPTAPVPQANGGGTLFVPSFTPFKPEKKLIVEWEDPRGIVQWKEKYPYGYGLDRDAEGNLTGRFKEEFRSREELKWAEAFDDLGLQWEYEPLRFDMGPKHFYYTPDFTVTGLSIPDSDRPLYIEIKWFGEDMDLTKYVRFTEWYNCNLLVLAHDGGRGRRRNNVLKPEKERYFLILKCAHCGTYDWFPYNEFPTDDYIRRAEKGPRRVSSVGVPEKILFGYRLAADGTFWLATEEPPSSAIAGLQAAIARLMPFRDHPPVCQETPLERMAVPNYFLIQAGAIKTGRVVLPDRGCSELRMTDSGRDLAKMD